MADRAVFLACDGVLIADKGYLTRPEDVDSLSGVPETLLRLQAKAWRLVVVTHQPRPGLLLRAARELGIDLAQSVMIGESASAVDAGRAAGCRLSLFSFPGYLSTPVGLVLKLK